jgi:dihydroorotate dehydrogenase (NAD+) catalytic subunit
MNLAVQIGKISMRNPVMTASGTFGFGKELADLVDINRLGAIVVKGTSLRPWKGNPPPRTCETPAGLLNAIGLQNDGVDDFIENKLPFLRQFETPVIVNIVGHAVEEYVEVARRLDEVDGIAGLEINISCPNVKEGCIAFGTTTEGTAEVVSAVRKVTKLTLITKLSPNVTDITEIAKAAVDAGSDALSLINTLLGTAIDPWTKKFRLANITGGLSGPAIKPIALRMVYETAKSVDVPIVGMGGITNGLDAVEFLLAGASAVAVGTSTFLNPTTAIDVADGIAEYMKKAGVNDVKELIGSVSE